MPTPQKVAGSAPPAHAAAVGVQVLETAQIPASAQVHAGDHDAGDGEDRREQQEKVPGFQDFTHLRAGGRATGPSVAQQLPCQTGRNRARTSGNGEGPDAAGRDGRDRTETIRSNGNGRQRTKMAAQNGTAAIGWRRSGQTGMTEAERE